MLLFSQEFEWNRMVKFLIEIDGIGTSTNFRIENYEFLSIYKNCDFPKEKYKARFAVHCNDTTISL